MVTMPVDKGFVVTSPFGQRWGTLHAGTDFGKDGGSAGYAVYAVKSGTVLYAGAATGYGGPDPAGWLVLDHPASAGGGTSEYGHIIREVSTGAKVAEGQRIGRINPNQSTNGGVAPHLHFSWMPYDYRPSAKQDPMATVLKGARWPGQTAPTPPKENPVSYFDVDWSPRFNFGGPRSTSGIQRVVVHTTENTAGTPAENVANYQITSKSGSYHVLVDTTGKRLRENTDDWVTWSVGNNAGNVQGLNISFVAQAAWSRATWLAQDRMLRQGATVVAHWCKTYNIPVQKVGTARGICGHGDLRVFGGTDHTDPGGNFPWDVFIRYVNEAISGTNQPKEWSDMASKEEIRQVVREEIAAFCGPIGHDTKRLAIQFGLDADDDGFGRVPGWVQGGHRALYDLVSAIAEKAGVPRTKDTLPEAPKNARNPKLKG